MSHMDYMNVTALANVFARHTAVWRWGIQVGEAIAVGTPMVTWPGEYLRGRYTQALYRLLGSTDAIAGTQEEYIDLAVQFSLPMKRLPTI